ncbi:hypothetical protein [Novosphingobium sp. KN65.2]|uniref:hypothetical protein n=1 Tax=Novosphingobium sp. KN65.2 TaxID=1478134 RepID=UPI0005E98E54|nr:hypothetical protein [Novosphingobium sp. KN65.2]CDO36013.1 hypothetical protein SPHV1_2290029 [Novosphingobium sp. KN65.2]
MHDLKFTSAQVAEAIGMSHDNFRAHLSRKDWRIIGKEQPENGKAHSFSVHDVLGYALARILTTYGIDTKTAFQRAMFDFAHTGDDERGPGEIYDSESLGLTFYVYSHGARLGECLAEKRITSVGSLLRVNARERAEAAVIVDLTAMRDRVFQALGLDSRDYE